MSQITWFILFRNINSFCVAQEVSAVGRNQNLNLIQKACQNLVNDLSNSGVCLVVNLNDIITDYNGLLENAILSIYESNFDFKEFHLINTIFPRIVQKYFLETSVLISSIYLTKF